MDDSIGGSWHSPGAPDAPQPPPPPPGPPPPASLARLSSMLRFAYAVANLKKQPAHTPRGGGLFKLFQNISKI